MSKSSLAERCYAMLHLIPKGKVTTYKLLAEALGTKGYRAVGQVLKRNPNPIICPCHRVVSSDGKIGGFALGVGKKIELLEGEGINVKKGRVVDLKRVLYC